MFIRRDMMNYYRKLLIPLLILYFSACQWQSAETTVMPVASVEPSSTLTPIPALTAQPQLSLSNSSKVVFASGGNIYTIDINNNELTRVAHVGFPLCCPRWSPDRQKIAFAIGCCMYHGVYVVDADGSNLKRLTYIQRTEGDSPPLSPVWSEDSQHIDFVYGAYGYGGLKEVTSPDGQYIAFVVSRYENDRRVSELYVKNADGIGVPKLITTAGSIWGIDW
jgi:Tol biopolymer transport system component